MPTHHRAPLQFLQKPVTISALVLLLGFISYHYVVSLQRGYQLEQRVQSMQTDIDELHTRREELLRMKEMIESPDYLEREARAKLGLKKKGEYVIIVPDETVEALPRGDVADHSLNGQYAILSYPQRWFYYFFGSEGTSGLP